MDRSQPDVLTWDDTLDGNYIVKSGYQAIKDWEEHSNIDIASSSTTTNDNWKNIWYARNQRVFQNKYIPPFEVSSKAVLQLHEYQQHGKVTSPLHCPHLINGSSHNNFWSPKMFW
ncbi:hypothetical protein A2U01_0035574 [Trifolium medium]|uniref:Uncharacterized protein n=1 Tax=Trifolium medium TaxID=97028 RepID=A0A392PQR7_9FABA|nr:hypothetical protein [Trifolium medium]